MEDNNPQIPPPAGSGQAPFLPPEPAQSTGGINPPTPTPAPPSGHESPNKTVLWLAMAIIILGLAAGALYWYKHKSVAPVKTAASVSKASGASGGSTPASAATPAKATDNTSLQQDLSGVNQGLSQSSTDQTSADNGLNDQQSQIQVPTN